MTKSWGMSLIEVLIALAIVGLFAAVGIPALRDYMNNTKIHAAATSITAGLHQARTEAIRRNTATNFVPSSTAWQIIVPAVGNTPSQTITSNNAGAYDRNITVTSSIATVTFTGRGRITNANGATIDLSTPASGTCVAAGGVIRCLRVTVSGSGEVKLCDPALALTDPRAC